MTHRHLIGGTFVLLLVTSLSAPAWAQTPATANAPEGPKHSLAIGGGIGFVTGWTTSPAGSSGMAGWNVSFGGTFDGKYAAIGEVSGGSAGGRSFHQLLWGARYFVTNKRRVTPFVQFLAGHGRNEPNGPNSFVLQPGGGIEIRSKFFGVRLQGDVNVLRQPANAKGFRFVTSIVF